MPVTLTVRDLPKEQPDHEDEVTVESSARVQFAMRCIDVPTFHIRSAGVVNYSLHTSKPLRIALGDRKYAVTLRSSKT